MYHCFRWLRLLGPPRSRADWRGSCRSTWSTWSSAWLHHSNSCCLLDKCRCNSCPFWLPLLMFSALSLGAKPWSNIMEILEEKDGVDTELLVYAMTLVNKVCLLCYYYLEWWYLYFQLHNTGLYWEDMTKTCLREAAGPEMLQSPRGSSWQQQNCYFARCCA